MKEDDIYKLWRDHLLIAISERICKPCTDERKKKYTINYENPLLCGCRCDRVNEILEKARELDEDISKYSEDKKNSITLSLQPFS